MADDPTSTTPQSPPDEDAEGFSTSEKLLGAAAVYKAPLLSALAANVMADHETNPVRRRQLLGFRNAAVALWVIGALIGLIVVVVVVAVFVKSGAVSDKCRGGYDRSFIEGTTYESSDGKHWTATYQCNQGGHTTVPVPRGQVPGGGF